MDYILGLSVFLALVGGTATAAVAVAYRIRHRHDERDNRSRRSNERIT